MTHLTAHNRQIGNNVFKSNEHMSFHKIVIDFANKQVTVTYFFLFTKAKSRCITLHNIKSL